MHHYLKPTLLLILLLASCGGASTPETLTSLSVSDVPTIQKIVPPIGFALYGMRSSMNSLDSSDITQTRSKMLPSNSTGLGFNMDMLTQNFISKQTARSLSIAGSTTATVDVAQTLGCSDGGTITTTGSISMTVLTNSIKATVDLSFDLQDCTDTINYYEIAAPDTTICSENISQTGTITFIGYEESDEYGTLINGELLFSTNNLNTTRAIDDSQIEFAIAYDNYNASTLRYDVAGTISEDGFIYDAAEVISISESLTAAQICEGI